MKRAIVVWLLGAAACVSGTPRPVPPAAEFQVEANPAIALDAALGAVADLGLPVLLHDPTVGVIETSYIDLATLDPSASTYSSTERLVRFRIVSVPAETSRGSTVAIEARYSPFARGGDFDRRRERAIPRDHPGMRLVRQLEEAIVRRADGR